MTSRVVVTLDGARTIGTVRFDDLSGARRAWTLTTGSGGPLTLDGNSPGIYAGVPTTIGAVLAGTNGFTLSGTLLVLTNANTYSGTTRIAVGILGYQSKSLGRPIGSSEQPRAIALHYGSLGSDGTKAELTELTKLNLQSNRPVLR